MAKRYTLLYIQAGPSVRMSIVIVFTIDSEGELLVYSCISSFVRFIVIVSSRDESETENSHHSECHEF